MTDTFVGLEQGINNEAHNIITGITSPNSEVKLAVFPAQWHSVGVEEDKPFEENFVHTAISDENGHFAIKVYVNFHELPFPFNPTHVFLLAKVGNTAFATFCKLNR